MSRLDAAAVVLACSIACRDQPPAADPAEPKQRPLSPPARSIRVEDDQVVLQGRWQPIDAKDGPVLPNPVRVVCARQRNHCREELTTPAAGGEPATEQADYDVMEWTSWRLVAARRTGGGEEVELQVALRGGAATKALRRKGGRDMETRWRLE